MKRLSVIIGLMLLLASCTGDKAMMPLLERAEGYLPDYPDSASMVLDSIGSLPRGSGERVRSLYGLLRTMTDAMMGKGVTSDSLIRPAYIYYKESSSLDDIRRLGRSAFYLARFEASRDSTKQAEDLYREAIHCSEQVEDWRTCYLAYYYFAREKAWSDKEEALLLLNTAMEIYHKVEDKPANLISMLLSLSNIHLAFQHYDLAFEYTNKAYDIAREENLEIQTNEALRNLSVIYYETGDYIKSIELAKQSMHGLTDQTRDAALFSLADCYLACDSLEQAKTTLLQIDTSNIKLNYSIMNVLCRIAILQHNKQESMAYYDSLEKATVNMFTNIQQTKEDYYNDNIQKELNNERLALTSLRQKMVIAITLLVLAIVITVFTVVFLFNKQRHRLQRYADIQRTRNYISIQNAKQRELRLQIGANKELVHQKSITSSLLQKHFLRHLADIKTDLESSEDVKMNQIIWQEIEDTLNATDNGFVRTIRKEHPDFDEEDVQLCMLVRMKVPNSVITKIFHIGIDAIKKRRKTLKRNGFNCLDNDETLDEIIEKIC